MEKSATFTDLEIAEIMEFMESLMARRQTAITEEVTFNPSSELHWHCMLCGHSWEGWVKINPIAPATCANCHKPNWSKCPKSGPHDPNCEECQTLIKRQIKELDELEYIRKFVK